MMSQLMPSMRVMVLPMRTLRAGLTMISHMLSFSSRSRNTSISASVFSL